MVDLGRVQLANQPTDLSLPRFAERNIERSLDAALFVEIGRAGPNHIHLNHKILQTSYLVSSAGPYMRCDIRQVAQPLPPRQPWPTGNCRCNWRSGRPPRAAASAKPAEEGVSIRQSWRGKAIGGQTATTAEVPGGGGASGRRAKRHTALPGRGRRLRVVPSGQHLTTILASPQQGRQYVFVSQAPEHHLVGWVVLVRLTWTYERNCVASNSTYVVRMTPILKLALDILAARQLGKIASDRTNRGIGRSSGTGVWPSFRPAVRRPAGRAARAAKRWPRSACRAGGRFRRRSRAGDRPRSPGCRSPAATAGLRERGRKRRRAAGQTRAAGPVDSRARPETIAVRGSGGGVFLVQALHEVVDFRRADAAHQGRDPLARQRLAGRMPDEQDRLQDAPRRDFAGRVVGAADRRRPARPRAIWAVARQPEVSSRFAAARLRSPAASGYGSAPFARSAAYAWLSSSSDSPWSSGSTKSSSPKGVDATSFWTAAICGVCCCERPAIPRL